MRVHRFYILLVMELSTTLSFAQVDVEDQASWKDRIYTGGGGGFSGGSNNLGKFFSISVSPIVGYMITQQASAGLGISYQYTSYSDLPSPNSYSMYGVSPFVRYNFKELFLTAEYNYLSIPINLFSTNSDRVFRDRMLLGAGYSVPMGGSGRGRINAMALYDVLFRPGNGFSSPWVFRVFFSF